ncbi:uncharacterized protein LOC106177272 isoform X2 [Lingula anatina]|uniref:Uncharacterized protein LOC106177272 isoform X2 n=1 Tax=Lingula anatina TaxID=7574 RepID=A0A1S3JZC9_LINAN|nr:uncharacterized protein LOC106177272 isoform X2 [Lingula anatina]|eukprot:XP_013415454.1 uncharacterized protein LOC106177272 isoform X2 [Lingula anatina]
MDASHTQLFQTGQPPDRFRYGALKCLGGFQIALGLLIIGCGAADLHLNYFAIGQNPLPSNTNMYYHRNMTFNEIGHILTVVSAPIWCGAWRNSFQTFSILTAIIFGPTAMGLVIVSPFFIISSNANILQYVFFVAAGGLGFIEWIVAIVSASVCCCCSPIDQQETQVLYIPGSVPGQPYYPMISTAQQQQQQLPPQSQHYMSPTAPMGYQQPGPHTPYQTAGGPSYQNPNYQQPGGNWT